MVKKAESFVESLFFKYETLPEKDEGEESSKAMQTVLDKQSLQEVNLKLFKNENRKLVFDDENSLALKSLRDGEVDFADKRVNI